MNKLSSYEIRVAYSMVSAASKIEPNQPTYNPIEKYIYLWIAFNNIYQIITDYKGRPAELKRLSNGTVDRKTIDKLQMPKVELPSEREQIELTIEEFDADLRDRLIKHESTNFFVYRTPCFHGHPIEKDSLGQKLNGVLNISRTVSRDFPFWSPIDTDIYERYIASGIVSQVEIDLIVKQIIVVLYSVRNNLFHGGKRMDDSNDIKVVDKAIPLLQLVVSSFMI